MSPTFLTQFIIRCIEMSNNCNEKQIFNFNKMKNVIFGHLEKIKQSTLIDITNKLFREKSPEHVNFYFLPTLFDNISVKRLISLYVMKSKCKF